MEGDCFFITYYWVKCYLVTLPNRLHVFGCSRGPTPPLCAHLRCGCVNEEEASARVRDRPARACSPGRTDAELSRRVPALILTLTLTLTQTLALTLTLTLTLTRCYLSSDECALCDLLAKLLVREVDARSNPNPGPNPGPNPTLTLTGSGGRAARLP